MRSRLDGITEDTAMTTDEMIEGTTEVTIEAVIGETTNIVEEDQEIVLGRG